MMWSLTLLAPVARHTVIGEVANTQTVYAMAILMRNRQFLLMQQMFELGTGVKWVFPHLAGNALTYVDISINRSG